jgi:hypothetical protein
MNSFHVQMVNNYGNFRPLSTTVSFVQKLHWKLALESVGTLYSVQQWATTLSLLKCLEIE